MVFVLATTAAGLLGLLLMALSLLFMLLVVGDELASSDYRDYGAEWPCHLNTVESDRVYSWSLVALFMWLTSQGTAFMKFKGNRELFERNEVARRTLDFVLTTSGQLYLGALFLLATHFEWAMTCNHSNATLTGSNFLWGSAGLWIAGVAFMHAMPKRLKQEKNATNIAASAADEAALLKIGSLHY